MDILQRARSTVVNAGIIESSSGTRSNNSITKRLTQLAIAGAAVISLSACGNMPPMSGMPGGPNFGGSMFSSSPSISPADQQSEQRAIIEAVNEAQRTRRYSAEVRWQGAEPGVYGKVTANSSGTNAVGDKRFHISSSARVGGQIVKLREINMSLTFDGNLVPERNSGYRNNNGNFRLRDLLGGERRNPYYGEDLSENASQPEPQTSSIKIG